MDTIRRVALMKFASAAYEMGLERFSGVLARDESGQWLVGDKPLRQWLSQHQGEEVVVVMGSLADTRPLPPRTCRTCGRDYQEMECPHCRSNRIRLRGTSY